VHIAVLGGAGLMGRVAVKDMVMSGVERITVADSNTAKGEELKRTLWGSGVEVVPVDASDPGTIARAVWQAEVVVNALPMVFNVGIMKACLEAGIHYLDLGGLYYMTREQLNMDGEFKEGGLTALLGMGSTPGTLNVMTRYAVDQLDAVETIRLLCIGRDLSEGSPSPIFFPYSVDTILDEFYKRPVVLKDGELGEDEPLSGFELVQAPEPIGVQEVRYSLHSELATMPQNFRAKGLKNLSFKIAFQPEFREKVKFLTDLGLTSLEAVRVGDQQVVPREVLKALYARLPQDPPQPHDWELLRTVVTGTRDGRGVEYCLDVLTSARLRDWGMDAGALNTGTAPSIAAQMLARGDITERGAVAPETAVDPGIYFKELAARGMPVRCTVSYLA